MSEIIRQYRESHHRIAEMIAMGCTPSMIRRRLGVSQRRLSILSADPSFQELVLEKSREIKERDRRDHDLYYESAFANMVQSELALQDALDEHFEEDGQKLSVSMLNKVSMDRADRFGYGKNSTVKVEHDLGNLLERAIKRSGVQPLQIEAQAEPILDFPLRDPGPTAMDVDPAPKSEPGLPPPDTHTSEGPSPVSLLQSLRRRRIA